MVLCLFLRTTQSNQYQQYSGKTAHAFNKTLAKLIATQRCNVFLNSQIAPLRNNYILTIHYTVNVQFQVMAKPLLLWLKPVFKFWVFLC